MNATLSDFLSLVTTGAVFTGLALASLPLGPGRALSIALRSRLSRKPPIQCLRSEQLSRLRHSLTVKDYGQGYPVVMGERGVGKTCLINSAVNQLPGVITLDALPEQSPETILENALKKVAGIKVRFVYPNYKAECAIFFHRLFTGGHSPIVIIQAKEPRMVQEPAELMSPVRSLVEDYRLRVVVEGSPCALETRLLHSHRERVFEIHPMTKDQIWEMQQFQELFKTLKETGLEDIVFGVLCGIPEKYEKLWNKIKVNLHNTQDAREIIGNHLCHEVSDAMERVDDFCKNDDAIIAKLTKLFQGTRVFTRSILHENNIDRPFSDNVFREVEQERMHALAPATHAIGIVLRHGLTKELDFEELEELMKRNLKDL